MPRSRFFQTLGNLSVNTQTHPFSWHASTWVYSPWFSLIYSPSSPTVPSSSQHHWSVSKITLLYEFAFLKQNIRGLVPAWVSLLLPYTCRQMLFHTSGSQPRTLAQASESTLRIVTLPLWWETSVCILIPLLGQTRLLFGMSSPIPQPVHLHKIWAQSMQKSLPVLLKLSITTQAECLGRLRDSNTPHKQLAHLGVSQQATRVSGGSWLLFRHSLIQ